MIDNSLYRIAVEIAGTGDVETKPNCVILYSISYQPTKANKEAAEAYLSKHPHAVLIDQTPCGQRLIKLGFDQSHIDNDQDKEKVTKVWQLASRRFIESASGNITAFVDNADPRSVFRSEELPAILENDKITTINGIEKRLFASRFEEFQDATSEEAGLTAACMI